MALAYINKVSFICLFLYRIDITIGVFVAVSFWGGVPNDFPVKIVVFCWRFGWIFGEDIKEQQKNR